MRAILMLHAVDCSGSVLSLRPDELEDLISEVQSSGHVIATLASLLADLDAPDRVALTFDDGLASVAEKAAPILRDAGCVATVFLTTGHLARNNRWPSQPLSVPVLPMMNWEQVETLARHGWEIGAHTITHPDLRTASDEVLERELLEPKQEIARHLGGEPEAFAYPYGALDARVVAAVRRHYRHAVTARLDTLDGSRPDPHLIPRVDAFYLRRRWVRHRFGRPGFRGYVRLRALLRRLRRHSGEARWCDVPAACVELAPRPKRGSREP